MYWQPRKLITMLLASDTLFDEAYGILHITRPSESTTDSFLRCADSHVSCDWDGMAWHGKLLVLIHAENKALPADWYCYFSWRACVKEALFDVIRPIRSEWLE